MTKKNNKKNIYLQMLYWIILILFISLTTLVSLKHEYWADEINAWLISRDSSVIELFTKYLRADGHPALFHLVIKFFQFFGLKIASFRIISILFSSLGVALLLFKSNYKWYLKILLPFTYFIFYQYTVVTRGYTMILFLLSLIALLWQKRKEKCLLYSFLLILLLSLESYTFFIAGSLYLLYIIEFVQDYQKEKKLNKKYLISLIIIFIAFLLTLFYVYPRSYNTFIPSPKFYYISDSFISSFKMNSTIKSILSAIVITILLIVYYPKKTKKEGFEALVLIIPLFLFMEFKYCNLWHNGIFFLLIIFMGWIHNYEKSKIFNLFLLITCIIQIPWSIKTSIYDYKNSYSQVKEVADFVKTFDYENLKIYGDNYYDGSLNAYFDKNIFDNWDSDIGFYYWHTDAKHCSIPVDPESLKEQNVDIYIVTQVHKEIDHDGLRKYYDVYTFETSTYFENNIYETITEYVYVNKDLNKKA